GKARGRRRDGVLGWRLRPRRTGPLPQRGSTHSLGANPPDRALRERAGVGREWLAMGKPVLRRSLCGLALPLPRATAARARALGADRGGAGGSRRPDSRRAGLGAVASPLGDGPARRPRGRGGRVARRLFA